VKRGEIWTAAAGGDYGSKPRPVLINQSDFIRTTNSVLVCGINSTQIEADLLRIMVEPSVENGLRNRSWIMVDKMGAAPVEKFGKRAGRLETHYIAQLNLAIFRLTGLIDAP
jgi:mRNA interferase MazF